MSMHIQQARPPHVVYERRAEEDRTAPIEQGRYVSRDVDYAIVTPAGSKDRVERVVTGIGSSSARRGSESRALAGRKPGWTNSAPACDSWARGQTPPESGTRSPPGPRSPRRR